MPWTPIASSASRTSSSLKGLMMAITSFMDAPPSQLLWPADLCIRHGQAARGLSYPVTKIEIAAKVFSSFRAALPQKPFLGDGRHQGAVGGEDQPAREAA